MKTKKTVFCQGGIDHRQICERSIMCHKPRGAKSQHQEGAQAAGERGESARVRITQVCTFRKAQRMWQLVGTFASASWKGYSTCRKAQEFNFLHTILQRNQKLIQLNIPHNAWDTAPTHARVRSFVKRVRSPRGTEQIPQRTINCIPLREEGMFHTT